MQGSDAGSSYTLASVGAADKRGLTVFTDDLTAPPAGQARVRVINAAPPAPVLERQDLKALVGEALRPYQPALPPGVRLSFEVNDGVPAVMADRRLLERAVVNLLENALQAVGEYGTIRVRLRSAEAGRRAEIDIEDSGAGIDTAVKDHLFEPFFSTKTSGSGLGLALVKRIAEDHGGGVSLEPAPGHGTRAILWLPADAPAPGH